jgi:hypothetical protein
MSQWKTAHEVIAAIARVKRAGDPAKPPDLIGDVKTWLGNQVGPQGDDPQAQQQLVSTAKTVAQDGSALHNAATQIRNNKHVQDSFTAGVQQRAQGIPMIGGLFGSSGTQKTAFLDITPDALKADINKSTTEALASPEKAKQLGSSMAGIKNPKQPSGVSPGTEAFVSHMGDAISDELPTTKGLNLFPSMAIGASNLFKKFSGLMDKLPAEVGAQAGDQFKGSDAARGAAETISPMVNQAFGSLWDNSAFGKVTNFFKDPGSLIDQKAKEMGIKPQNQPGAAQQPQPQGAK